MEKENVKYKTKVMGEYDMFNIGICDDEKGTGAQLEKWCCEYGKKNGMDIEVHVWQTGEGLCEDIANKKEQVDMLFLDIELISTNGIKVGKFIRDKLENLEMAIVYISSKSSYAMGLFRVQPIDFLIKPLEREKVEEVITRGVRLYERKNQHYEYYTKVDGHNHKVPYKEIIYFYSQNKKINIVTKNGEMQFNGKLKDVASEVPHNFILIHKSYLINLDYISECSYELMKMSNGALLNISQPYRKSVKEQITKKTWEKMK